MGEPQIPTRRSACQHCGRKITKFRSHGQEADVLALQRAVGNRRMSRLTEAGSIGRAVQDLKQRSTQQTVLNAGLSAHQTRPDAVIQRAQQDSPSLKRQGALQLQRAIGNRAVGRLVTSATGNAGPAHPGGLVGAASVIQRTIPGND